jgi:hypothetical protein
MFPGMPKLLPRSITQEPLKLGFGLATANRQKIRIAALALIILWVIFGFSLLTNLTES